MTNTTLSKPLLTGAAILLSAAYLITLYHEASQEKSDDFPMLVTVMFVPAIISAVSFLAYQSSFKKRYLTIGRIFTILCVITCIFDVYLMFVAIDSIMVDFDTTIYGLLYELPLVYLISLVASSLSKKTNNLAYEQGKLRSPAEIRGTFLVQRRVVPGHLPATSIWGTSRA
jgi:hypothetical protein